MFNMNIFTVHNTLSSPFVFQLCKSPLPLPTFLPFSSKQFAFPPFKRKSAMFFFNPHPSPLTPRSTPV